MPVLLEECDDSTNHGPQQTYLLLVQDVVEVCAQSKIENVSAFNRTR
jgi:hypothetical protein